MTAKTAADSVPARSFEPRDSSAERNRDKLDSLQEAAKLIEIDGNEGYQTACKRVGQDLALALLVMHLRRNLGSMKTFPDPEIDDKVRTVIEMALDGGG